MKEHSYSQYDNRMNPESMSEQLLDQILKTDVMPPLPEDFADRIAIKAVRRITFKQSMSEFFIYTAVVVTIGMIFIGILYFTHSGEWIRWEQFFMSRINLLAGISLILFFVFFVDIVLFPLLFLRKRGR